VFEASFKRLERRMLDSCGKKSLGKTRRALARRRLTSYPQKASLQSANQCTLFMFGFSYPFWMVKLIQMLKA